MYINAILIQKIIQLLRLIQQQNSCANKQMINSKFHNMFAQLKPINYQIV